VQAALRDPTIPDTVRVTRSKRVTWAIVAASAFYALMLAGGAAVIVGDSGTGAHDKVVACAVLVLLPALAYAAALAPLWHRSRNRVRLGAVASVAVVVALVIAALTLGVALPISLFLVAVAVADIQRALALGGIGSDRPGLLAAAVVATVAVVVGIISLTFAAGAIVLACLVIGALAFRRRTARP
jgi:hypothetical protein